MKEEKQGEGLLRERIREKFRPDVNNHVPDVNSTWAMAVVDGVALECKGDLAEVIQEPDIDDYELTIPFQQQQYEKDLERFNRFQKWFGEVNKK